MPPKSSRPAPKAPPRRRAGGFFGGLLRFVLLVTLVTGLVLALLLRSPWGKAFTALRDNPIRAESLGIDTRSYTLMSFAIGATFAGLAGGLYASQVGFIDPALFTVGASIMMYLMVVVGGPGYFLGPVLGAAVGVVMPEWLRDVPKLADWYLPMFGAAVVLLMIWWKTRQDEKQYITHKKCPCCTSAIRKSDKVCSECFVDLEGR